MPETPKVWRLPSPVPVWRAAHDRLDAGNGRYAWLAVRLCVEFLTAMSILPLVPEIFDRLRSNGLLSIISASSGLPALAGASVSLLLLVDLAQLVAFRESVTVGGSAAAATVGPVTKQVGSRDVAQTVLAILARWNIGDDQGSTILGSPATAFLSMLQSGRAALDTRDMRDRARIFFDIYEGVYGLLQDPKAERDWIRAPRTEFEGQSVLDLMTEGSQRNLIRALGFVDYASGR